MGARLPTVSGDETVRVGVHFPRAEALAAHHDLFQIKIVFYSNNHTSPQKSMHGPQTQSSPEREQRTLFLREDRSDFFHAPDLPGFFA